jgi:DNA-binding protein YbaB
MKKVLFIFSLSVLCSKGHSQLIMREEMKEPKEGICNHNEVYALYGGFKGQVEPKCSRTKEEIQNLLNEKVIFLKTNPKFKGKGMVSVYINCRGETVDWRISVKTKNDELDKEILEVFKTLQTWTAGKMDGKNVDASVLTSYKIKKGSIEVQ